MTVRPRRPNIGPEAGQQSLNALVSAGALSWIQAHFVCGSAQGLSDQLCLTISLLVGPQPGDLRRLRHLYSAHGREYHATDANRLSKSDNLKHSLEEQN